MSKEWPLWEIFIRGNHGLNHRHVGSLHAPDAEMAIRNARDVYTRRKEGVSIWVVRSNDITASSPSEKGPMFDPAESKAYRHPTFYDIPDDVGAYVMAEVVALETRDPLFGDDRAAAFDWLCRLGDATLILGHRLSEWCGKGPALEEDIALANVSLDLIGHTEMWLALAGEVEGQGRSADDLAYLRDAMKFRNPLLVELPNRDMALTTMRQFLFDAWHFEMLSALTESRSPRVAEIAAKALKEVSYHLERSQDLVIRLGDGTEESHARMQDALERLWPFTGELFAADSVDAAIADAGIGPAADTLKAPWNALVAELLAEATLTWPETKQDAQTGGKTGRHTEHLGILLAEMQFLQRAYPGGGMVSTVLPDIDTVRGWLDAVPDPEIPVISVNELGIVRSIDWQGDTLVVAITPTYSGCPAVAVIEMEIEAHLRGKGVEKLRIERRLSPAWTTDWITPEARQKLKRYGIAPPIDGTASDGRLRSRAARMAGGNMAVECPRCGSTATEEVSRFGSTPCKASWRCTDCLEPFDYFKCI